MKKLTILTLSAVALASTNVAIIPAVKGWSPKAKVYASTEPPVLSIEGKNMSYQEKNYLMFASKVDNIGENQVKLLEWNEPQEEYVIGTESYSTSSYTSTNINGEAYRVYYSDGISPKNFVDDLYFRLYVSIGDRDYYSDLVKYSALMYFHNRLNTEGISDAQREVYESSLSYAASLQKLLNYKTDTLATDTFYTVDVVDGKLSDGTTSGLYKEGTEIELIAYDEKDGDPFARWTDSDDNNVGDYIESSVTVTSNITYTAIYEEMGTKGLAYTELPDGTYSVSKGTAGNLANIIIPKKHDGRVVSQIASQAFQACSRLVWIDIPDTVTVIGNDAFRDCTNISSVVIPNNVKALGERSFYGCKNLVSVELPNSLSSIEDYTFYDCSRLSSINIPSDVVTIGRYSFSGCTSLPSVELPDGLTKIGDGAFQGCHLFSSIDIPDTVTAIGMWAFSGCSRVTSLFIPSSVTSLWGSSFPSCSLTSIVVDENNPVYSSKDGCNAVLNKRCTVLICGCNYTTIPYGVSTIGASAFESCSGIVSIDIPDTVRYIEGSAFRGCTGLESITIPSGVQSISERTFYGCISLASIVLPDTLYSVNPYAFAGCSSLSSIEVPSNVRTIGSYAFQGCSSLESIAIPSGVTKIEKSLFEGCSSLSSIDIPSTVSTIDEYAFDGCSSLASVNIPSGVRTVGGYAFRNCSSITSISIPSGVKEIKNNTFFGCSSLAYISIPETVTSIGSSAFYNCSSLESIVVPSGVTIISSDTFSGCSKLTSVVLPGGLSSVGWGAFYRCDGLEKVYFAGNNSDWNGVTLSNSNTALKNASLYCYSEVEPDDEGCYWYYDNNGEIVEW